MQDEVKNIFESNGGYLRAKDITRRSQWYQLKKMILRGDVVKLSSGIYKLNDINIPQKADIAAMFPTGVYCLFTAWNYHALSTFNPWALHIAVGHKEKVLKPDYPPVFFYYWKGQSHDLGIIHVEEEGHPIKIFDLEKSVCDAVKFRNKVGMDTTIEVLQNYVKRQDKNLNKLSRYAEQLGIGKLVNAMIMLLL
jgi:predicted transcriptional regulator of viral defense system